ncbi:MAG: cytochrome-c peroxidase [Chloroflexales bacterium]|nr:cytochrome-c peroxidase [Chloroflexales bacterium]
MRRTALVVGLVVVAAAALAVVLWPRSPWSKEELTTLKSLSLASLPPLGPDPSNRVADDPRAAALGQRLFFDKRLSVDGTVACATCHDPAQQFQDGTPLGHGVGTTNRRTMPLAGVAYSPWLFWDGRKDSLWSQALGPLESPVEHGGTRTQYARLIAEQYRAEYKALFGPLADLSDAGRFPAAAGPVADPAARAAWEQMAPEDQELVNQIFANMGKAIAAYERGIMPGESRFDAYVDAALQGDNAAMHELFSLDETAGLRLFIGKGQCLNCHNGPLLTNNDFHNTGVPAAPGLPEDTGRATGLPQAQADPFNCLGAYSDAEPADCGELRFAKVDEHTQLRQFKPPSLRNVAERAPYMHAGQFASLREVLEHYNRAPASPAGHSELQPLNLSDQELSQLEAFLHTLSAPTVAPAPVEGTAQATCLGCHPQRTAATSTGAASVGQP